MRRLQIFRLIQKPLLLGLAAFVFQNVTAQETTEALQAKQMTEVIELDGELSEPIWQTAKKTTNFWQYFPSDNKVAKYQTTVQFAYDETALYVGIKAEAVNNNFVVSSLRRDFSGLRNDNVTILFDTFNGIHSQ